MEVILLIGIDLDWRDFLLKKLLEETESLSP